MPAGGGVGWREGKGGGKLRDFAAAAALGVVSFLVTQFLCGGRVEGWKGTIVVVSVVVVVVGRWVL